jgi:SAM-dependent methyltransferase
MSIDSLTGAALRLGVSVDTLAAVGAELQLRQEGSDGDPRVRALLQDIMRAADPRPLDDIDYSQEAAALALIRAIFRQAMDLLDNPGREAGWAYRDGEILQTQGQLSRLIVHRINAMAAQRSDLARILQRPGAFLDIGTGTGWLAIEAARSWPSLRVVGIDPWKPALALARQNLVQSGLAERIEFRSQRVEQLDEASAYTLAWIPGPFIGAKAGDRALPLIDRALKPGGWLIFGLNAPLPGPLEEAIASLRVVRWGGHAWKPPEVKERLRSLEFEEIETFPPGGPISFVVGRRVG